MKRAVLSFFKNLLLCFLSVVDAACIIWCGINIHDIYQKMLRRQGEVSFRFFCELAKNNEDFMPAAEAALIISLLLLLLILFSRDRKLAIRQTVIWFSFSVATVCGLMLLFFLFFALPAVFDGYVPLSTVLGDIVTILTASGMVLSLILAFVLIERGNDHEIKADPPSRSKKTVRNDRRDRA